MRTINEKHAPDKLARAVRSKIGSRRVIRLRSAQWDRTATNRGLAKILTQAKLSVEDRVRLCVPGCDVRLTRISPCRLRDASESLRSALAAVRDGVAEALGVDDQDAEEGGTVRWTYAQEKGSYGVRVELATRGTFSPIETLAQAPKPGFCRSPFEELTTCA